MKKYLLSLLLLTGSVISAIAQVETHYYTSESENPVAQLLNTKGALKVYSLPLIGCINKASSKDNADSSNMYNFGQDVDVSLTLSDGNWEIFEDGRVWSLGIESKDASSLTFIFKNLHLEEESKMYILSGDKSIVYGPVTNEVLINSKNLFSDIIPGSKAIIYLYEPNKNKGTSTLNITKVISGTGNDSQTGNRSNSDPACFPEWLDTADGVCMVTMPNGSMYFGSLLMTTNNSFIPYVLTTYQAIASYGADQLGFRFRVRRETCNGNDVATIYTFTGAQLRASWSVSDFALLELLSDVSKQPQISWLGWDKSSNIPSNTASFMRMNWVFKIVFKNSSPSSVVINDGQTTNEKWLVTNWNNGDYSAIMGAPLLNQDKRIVGHMNLYDPIFTYPIQYNYYFSKFIQSWNGGGTNSTRLSNWLDPINTGQTTQNSAYPPYITGADHICTSEVYTLNNCPPGASVVWELSGAACNQLSITQNSPTTNQCTITKISDANASCNIIAKVYRNNQYQYSIIKDKVLVGTPYIGMAIIPKASNGEIGYWSSNATGNTFTIENDSSWAYENVEAKLYRMDNNFNPSQLVASWNSISTTNAAIPCYPVGWYLFKIRGHNECGYSDWLEQEVEFVDASDQLLRIDYNSSSRIISITDNKSNSKTNKTSDNICELQIWNSSNTNLVRKVMIKGLPANIAVESIPSGIYVVRGISNGKTYSKKVAVR